ncbi:hypothetical protein RHMOL_Rhmol13G0075600 [Rhododendron molle]|uniref:Uncharacterized protein n=1 Tax=Rhododendron molle TaxID=49168 RepID=A0ACC0L5D8_RHOML|nr:hypothetical protein RHMOL_Rhmol13G0075600 [Rhododendron molle]
MWPSAIWCDQMQLNAAKSNSMWPKEIRCGQVQFDAGRSNSWSRVILCGHE